MNKIKVLIVEDEPIIAMEIKMEVEKLNCEVTGIVFTKNKVLSSIVQNEPNIILMDINLGKKEEDGISITKELQKTKNIPVLYITAFSHDNIIKRAFDTNLIGYIVKPFKQEDLKTNIQLAIHKLNLKTITNITKNSTYLGDDFYFDTIKRCLYYKDSFIKLGNKETHLLTILINANHSIVRFNDLEEDIWDGNKPSKSSLKTLVYRLKGKIGNNIIETTYGYGYNLKRL